MKIKNTLSAAFAGLAVACASTLHAPLGDFPATANTPGLLPVYAQTRTKLPSPIYDENPGYVRMYWKAWELAFANFYLPAPQSGFVTPFIDAAFSENIFLWDTCFMSMFTNVAHPLVPGIGSLDNFYAKQHDDGEICREINRTDGRDFAPWVNAARKDLFSHSGTDWQGKGFAVSYRDREVPRPPPHLTLDALNHPILAWAEAESYRMTGDRARLQRVYAPLMRYHRALQKYLRQGNGLYMSDWASMDNSPRNDTLVGGGTAIDTSSEMVLDARELADIAGVLGKDDDAAALRREASELAQTINAKMWNPARKFYFDLDVEGRHGSVKTVAAFWTLLAGVASAEQADALAAELVNPRTFGRAHRVPTVAADEKGFNASGEYWRGAVWAPTTTMVVRGLEKAGKTELAHEIANEHLRVIARVFEATNTIWENYAPDAAAPGKPAKRDFVGWSGIGPILYLIEYAIGIRANAIDNAIVWNLTSEKRVGIDKFRFGGNSVNLLCDAANATGNRTLRVSSDKPFVLVVRWKGKQTTIDVEAGKEIVRRL